MAGIGGLNSMTRGSLAGMPQAGAEKRPGGAPSEPAQAGSARDFSNLGVSAKRGEAGAGAADGDATQPKFGEVWQKIQADYGAKAEKPREVRKVLGKDDFMRLMIHQMRNQDPTSPFKADQMAQQMAQYASVEQMQNMNSQLSKIATANQPLERLAMAGLIGKTVTVSKERFVHTEGEKQALSFSLPRDAESVNVTVVNGAGEPVAQKSLGALKEGSNTFSWDGIQDNTLAAKSGSYAFKVEAKDANGSSIPLPTTGQSRVLGVSFDGQEPVLLVGDPKNPDKIPMSSVSRIADEESVMIPGARSLAAASAQAAPAPARPTDPHSSAIAMHHARSGGRMGETPPAENAEKAFFTFEKGKGSRTISGPGAEAGAPSALQQAQVARAYSGADAAPGFPNGLSDDAMEGEASP